MKGYFEYEFSVTEILLPFVILNLVTLALFFLTGLRYFGSPHKKIIAILLIFLGNFGLLVYAYDAAIGFLPFFPDTLAFYGIFSGMPIEWDNVTLRNFSLLVYPFRVFESGNAFVFGALNVILFISSLSILVLTWLNFVRFYFPRFNDRFPFFIPATIVLFTIWPAYYLYLLPPLREAINIFAFAVFIAGLVQVKVQTTVAKQLFGFGLVLLAVGLSFFVRPLNGLLYLALFYFFYPTNRFAVSLSKRLIIFVGAAVLGWLVLRGTTFGALFTPEGLALVRNARASYFGTDGYGLVEWQTWFDVLFDVPLLTFWFITSPITTSQNFMSYSGALLQTLWDFCAIAAAAVGYAGARLIDARLAEGVRQWLLLIFVMTVASSLYEFHVSDAVRHRMIISFALVPISSLGVCWLLFSKPSTKDVMQR